MNDKPRWWWSRARKEAWQAEQAARREAERDRRIREVAGSNARFLAASKAAHERLYAPVAAAPTAPGPGGSGTRTCRDDGTSDLTNPANAASPLSPLSPLNTAGIYGGAYQSAPSDSSRCSGSGAADASHSSGWGSSGGSSDSGGACTGGGGGGGGE